MPPSTDVLIKNFEVLKSRVNRFGIYGLIISLVTIVMSTIIVAYQMTGGISFTSLLYAQDNNFALRILNFLPFIFAFWGQYTGNDIAYRASAIIVEETDDLRAQTTEWKKKSLHDSTHDSLTELPNRALFYDLLRQAILVASRENSKVSVLFMDIDKFKEVNEGFGHGSGDIILKDLAGRLQALLAGRHPVARMGGDEFAIMMRDVAAQDDAVELVRDIHQKLKSPFNLDGSSIEVGVSIGISMYPEHGTAVGTLVQQAEIAMSAAKTFQSGYAVYSSDLNQENPRRVTLVGELRRAIENDQLELHYQPKIDIRTGKVIAAEALVRWPHPEYGNISPGEFIPLAERSRLIQPLTQWVIRKAIKDAKDWHGKGIQIGIAINISTRDLNDPGLPELFTGLLADRDVKPDWFTLEITESSIMDDPVNALGVLNRLSGMHLGLSIDDFGTGYSSLAYLSKLPVQEVKIDQTFVMGMSRNKDDAVIVGATIDLGHNLGLKVVAEGVENEQTWQLLKQRGCDIAQGYFMSPPLAILQFEAWLADTRWGPGKKA
jgi:diguanylate cyclase (GGDEF)-like protein